MAAVQGLGPAVEDLGIPAPGEVAEGEGGEHQLRTNLQGIEHAGAHLGVECSRRHPPLGALEHVAPDLLVPVRLPELGQAGHQFGRPCPGALQAKRGELATDCIVGELAEPVRCLHQVAVGVEYRSFHRAPRQVLVVVFSVDPRRLPNWGRNWGDTGPPGPETDWAAPQGKASGGNLHRTAVATGVTDNIYVTHIFL